MAEPTVVDYWIATTLRASTPLTSLVGGATEPRIYRGEAPEDAAYPHIVYYYLPGGNDVRGVGTVTIMSEGNWIIKVVHRSVSYNIPETIAGMIYSLLHGKTGTHVLACTREEPIGYSELLDNSIYQHMGGIYHIEYQ